MIPLGQMIVFIGLIMCLFTYLFTDNRDLVLIMMGINIGISFVLFCSILDKYEIKIRKSHDHD